MKKLKIGFIVVFLAFLVVIVFQNQGVFMNEIAMQLDLKFTNAVETPSIYTLYFFAIFFALGYLFSFFPSLVAKYKTNKEIKALNQQIVEKDSQIEELRTSIAGMGDDIIETDEFEEIEEPESAETPEEDADKDTKNAEVTETTVTTGSAS